MNITKFGHSCLLVEKDGTRTIFDPGSFSTLPDNLNNLQALFLTHNHQDHTDIEKIKALKNNNPQLKIYSNKETGKILADSGMDYIEASEGQVLKIENLEIEISSHKHENIFPGIPLPENTSFLVNNKLFIPGDSLILPNKPVQILALPIIAPWMKLEQAINFALSVKPKICFPIHDGFLKFMGPYEALPKNILEKAGVEFIQLTNNEPREF